MTTFICDRCGTQMKTTYRIIIPPKREVDLCEQCGKDLLEFLTEFLAKHE